jgi:hypothetical protein
VPVPVSSRHIYTTIFKRGGGEGYILSDKTLTSFSKGSIMIVHSFSRFFIRLNLESGRGGGGRRIVSGLSDRKMFPLQPSINF